MTYAALFVGASPTAPSPRVVIPVFQRTYCWSDQQVLGWWRDAAMRGGHSAMRVKGGHATGRCLFRRAREGRPEERTDAGADTEGEDEDADASPLLCLDGQQRCTTTPSPSPPSATPHSLFSRTTPTSRTTPERERWWNAPSERCTRTRRARVDGYALESPKKSDDDASYPEGARPPFATTLLPSFVDRAAFFRCIVGGALAFARGERSPRSPGSRSRDIGRPMRRAKATLDAAASSLLVPRATASVRLAAALDAMLEETRLTYVEIQGDAVNLAQAFQWLQEKTLFAAAGAVLWNPAPGVHLAGSDLIRNAILAVFLRRSLREQESAYRDAWLDPLERRVRAPDREVEVSRRRVSRVFGRRRARQRRTRARAVEMRVRARPRGDDGVGRHAGKTPRDGRRRIARVDIRAISSFVEEARALAPGKGRRRRREGGEKRPNQPRRRRSARAAISISRHPRRRRVRTRARRRRSRARRD